MAEFRVITFSISLFFWGKVMCCLLGFVARKPDYFHLQYQIRPDAHIVVGSTGLNQDGDWQILRSGQILVVERGTLDVTIVDVSYDTRTPIQEQYKSSLQR